MAYNNLGAALMHMGAFDEAIANFRRAIEIDPLLAEAYNNEGVGRKSPIREASFVGWPETFRWDHDGCVSVRSPRAAIR
jgi:tetratricopeptide (TPR) repeat protein